MNLLLSEIIVIIACFCAIGPIFIFKYTLPILRFIIYILNNILWFLVTFLLLSYNSMESLIYIFTIYEGTSILFGLDSVGLAYIWLTTFIITICHLVIWSNNDEKTPLLLFLINLIQLLLILSFLSYDILVFYFLFESILIPMFLIINIWGSRPEKSKAAYYLFFYTLVGSIPFLIAIMYIKINCGGTALNVISFSCITSERLIWLAFFIGFSVKIPMFPFHIWLPEAHVEAPTVGSVILAAILLKLGSFGYIRFMLPIFSYETTKFYWPLIICCAGSSILFSSLIALRQVDIKRIIAYSSIGHMNLVVLGIFSNNFNALNGAFNLTLGHGYVSAGLFLLIGTLYDRYHSRNILHFNGFFETSPYFSIFFILFSLANIGFPFSANFIGEVQIILGVINSSFFSGFIIIFSIFLSALYSLLLINNVLFGSSNTIYILRYYDLTSREILCFINLFLPILIFGFYPDLLENIWEFELLVLIES